MKWHNRQLMVVAGALILGTNLVACDSPVDAESPGPGKEAEYGNQEYVASVATPPGIYLQPLGDAQGYGLDKSSATELARDQIAYTDANGMTLYTHKLDSFGVSTCYDVCSETWPPVLAEAEASPVGAWSVIGREDGSHQWALNGKPVYTYVEDIHIGSLAGNSPKVLSRGENVGTRGSYRGPRPEVKLLPSDWEPALVFPAIDYQVPRGITVREVRDARGLVLVDSEANKTLYAFKGNPDNDRIHCQSPCEWQPASAPALASVNGNSDFGFVYRTDGIKQWTWKGMGLYTNRNDFGRNDANGSHEMWQVAHVLRYYMPDAVDYLQHPRLGKILVNEDGQTLYRREGFILKSGSGHSLHRGVPIRPAVGRDFGPDPRCRTECDKWIPFLADDDAVTSGYWDLYTREDGSRQWAYQNFALWLYTDDVEAGDTRAHDAFDVIFGVRTDERVDIGTPYDGATALHWHVATP